MKFSKLNEELSRLKHQQQHSLRSLLECSPNIDESLHELRNELLAGSEFRGRSLILTALNVLQADLRMCAMSSGADRSGMC